MADATQKVIVITGASSGIGEATAKLLASQGNKIVLGARREERLNEIAEAIKSAGGEATYKVTDVTSIEQVEALAQTALDAYGRIDVWINNAGLMPHSEFIKDKVNDWTRMIDVNLRGVLYGIHAALSTMREQKSGHFINISSVAGHIVGPGAGVYAATKFGVRALSDALRQEEALAQSHVRVTTISPGAIATELTDHVTDKEQKEAMDTFYNEFAVGADRVAQAIAFAINTPEDTGMSEIIIRPASQQL
ncbi:SDR family oxidoreductase [Lactiplantibacillus pentosus]|uniref:Oxidoreductase n=2 Tax=Lactiplantibacillus pentosus TaxID=1589 RepID=A0ABX5D1D2_LACPE|nr:SDR family oxidoreductase [Lactiplantibacillus pentosus]MCJ8186121.1 SDR family oxidoreductase [Lactiplantibacillus pentosus]MCT3309527.1 SDR family oxidoreductase [Lactiplantibacillus pentosus]PRO95384.1 oxidoreductase [Lactiplantibacillus pentosus]CCC15370.1 short-chain dehydrogenase [Lactiplantibacillus pentosus IG1]